MHVISVGMIFVLGCGTLNLSLSQAVFQNEIKIANLFQFTNLVTKCF